MTKKILSLFVALVMVFTLLSGCEQKTTPAPSASTSSTASTASSKDTSKDAFTITVSSWTLGTDANSSAFAKDYKDTVEKAYKVKYPNATITWDNFAGAGYQDVLKAKLASNSADDLFFHQQAIVSYANAGYLADMTSQAWASDIVDAVKAQCIVKGKVLGAPFDLSGWGTFYNKKVFTDLGIKAAPKTLTEFYADCELAKAKGIIPITAGFKDGWPAIGTYLAFMPSFIYGTNANWVFDLHDGKTKINSPEWIAAFNSLQAVQEKGYFSKSILSTTYDQALQEIGEGKAAMMFMGPWMVDVAFAKYGTEVGYFNIPDEKGNVFMTGSCAAVLSLNASYKDVTKGADLLNAMISKEAFAAIKAPISPYKSMTFVSERQGNKEYAEHLKSDKVTTQLDFAIPSSCSTILQQIVTEIAAGKKFDAKELDDADVAFQKDKGLVNVPSK